MLRLGGVLFLWYSSIGALGEILDPNNLLDQAMVSPPRCSASFGGIALEPDLHRAVLPLVFSQDL